MACTNVWNAFAVATEDLDNEVYKRASYQSVWLNIIQRGEYPLGVGLTRTVFTAGRQEPTADVETWPAVVTATGSAVDACQTTYADTAFGYSAVTYHPEQYGLRGPVLCKDELEFSHNAEEFLRIYLNALAIRARRSWENRYQQIFILASRKGIARADFALGAANATLTQPIATSSLTQEMLDNTAYELIISGATEPDNQGWINLGEQGPVFPLLIGLEMSNQLATNNDDLRSDIRMADAGSGAGPGNMLLQRIGANREIKNFRHIPNLFPPRYTYNGTAYVRVNTWEDTAGTKGTQSTVTAAYLAAPYEAAIVLSPWVFKSEIVRPVNSAAGLRWSPTNTLGEWQFVIGQEKWATDCVDPLQKYARHYAEFKHAPKPLFPEFGVTLIYKRCPLKNFATVYCT